MIVTTSSRKPVIQNLMDSEEDPLTVEEIRAHYGIVEPLTGDELETEVMKIQQMRNAQWKEANKK